MTLIVSLMGGPGVGKSTTASYVFAALKELGYNAELVHEVAKSATWEDHEFQIRHQPSLMGEQLRAFDRLEGQCEVVVTDTTTLSSLLYLPPDIMPEEVARLWKRFIVEDWRHRDTLNILLGRSAERPYNPAGRSQTEQEAGELDVRFKHLLWSESLHYDEVRVQKPADLHVDEIVGLARYRLRTGRNLSPTNPHRGVLRKSRGGEEF